MKTWTEKPLTSIESYMYGLKSRAHLLHCLGHATFPVDVTNLVAKRRHYSKAVRPVTLTPVIIKAVALAMRANPTALRILFQRFPIRRRIVSFDTVDLNIPITRNAGGERVTFLGVIRDADRKSIGDIQDELLHLQRDPPENVASLQKLAKLRNAPPVTAALYHWLMSRSPAFYIRNAGTCGLVPMDAIRGGHFFPIGPTTAAFGIGGIGDHVLALDGVPTVRRMLQISLSLDNYVVSGPEGLDLCTTLQELLESAAFVDDEINALAVAAA